MGLRPGICPNKPFCLFLLNLKATAIHYLNVSEETQSVLGDIYEPLFCEISLVNLYADSV